MVSVTSSRGGAPLLSRKFPPLPKPDPAELLRNSGDRGAPRIAAAAWSAEQPLDLEERPRSLTAWQILMVVVFTHVPHLALLGRLHIRTDPFAMFFLLYTTDRYARGDYSRFALRALVFGVLAAVFCVWLKFVLRPNHP